MMNCLTCHDLMVCYDDVNTMTIRIDFVRCKRCGSKATITYGDKGRYISKVTWQREGKIKDGDE